MSAAEHGEKEGLVKKTSDASVKPVQCFTNAVLRFFHAFKWLCAVLVLMGRIVGLFMFTVWAADCFLREFHTTALCESFSLFPRPAIFESAWLFLCATTSFFLICYVNRLTHFSGFFKVLHHLIRKKYFYKLTFILVLVCIYDLVVLSNKPKVSKTISYVLFMAEKSLAVVAVLFLNFFSSVKSRPSENNAAMKVGLYKAALVVYAIENYTMAFLGSMAAVYKVLTVSEGDQNGFSPTFQGNQTSASAVLSQESESVNVSGNPPGIEAVVDLMLLITNNGLRFYLADFFISKLFDQDLDILGGGTRRISESLPRKKDDIRSDQEPLGHVPEIT